MKKSLLLGIFLSAFFLSGCSNNNPQKGNTVEKTTPAQPVEKTTTSSYGEWREITHANFWKDYGDNRYLSDIKFSYPSNWHFECCKDTELASVHTIYSSVDNITKGGNIKDPSIDITEYALVGCPSNKKTCGLGETVEKTTGEVLDELIKNIPDSAKIKPAKILKSLNVNAFNYEMVYEDGIKVEVYIFKTEQEVVKIAFSHFDAPEAGFVDNFLEKIKNDKLQ